MKQLSNPESFDLNNKLLEAAEKGDLKLVKELLDQGADLEAKDKYGRRPLHNAVYYGHLEVVKLLLDRGADLEAKTNSGKTP